jgi:hypothetical protein
MRTGHSMGKNLGKWWCVLTKKDRQRIALAVRKYGPKEHPINNRTRYPLYDDAANAGELTFLRP